MADDKERGKAIEAALAQIDKQFGKGSIMRLGSREKVDVPAIPTGSLSLDAALGVGGVPRGRVIEIFGPESSGKTTLALHVIAEAQRRGGMAAFIDAEHALDAVYAGKLGVDTDNLLVSQPDSGEQALEIAEVLIRSGAVDVLVVDSVAALVPALGARRRDGRRADGHAGPPHEPGPAQAHLHRVQEQDLPHLHQPAPREDRRHVRQPRDHHRRPRAEVLRVHPPRHPPHRLAQGRRRGHRQPGQGQGGQEQGRARRSARPSSTSSTARASARKATSSTSASTTRSSRSRAPGTPSTASAWARAARTARQFLKDNDDIRNEIDARLRKGLGLPTPDAVIERAPKGEKADVLPMPEKKKA